MKIIGLYKQNIQMECKYKIWIKENMLRIEDVLERKKMAGKTEKGFYVIGFLSVLAFKFDYLEPGYYISNEAGSPFAYKVNLESIRIVQEENKNV